MEKLPVQGSKTESTLTLRFRAIRGSFWTVAGYGSNQVLRLGGNLVLTRLLFPEAFGLMALVQVFMQGLQMFSDFGIVPSIIQNPKGNTPEFLNTAWTLQALRGVGLWAASFAIALPAAYVYGEPQLAQLLPAAGLTAFISGLNSTRLATVNRQLELGRLTALEISSYVIGLVTMVVGAWLYPTIWMLVLGGVVSAIAKLVLSHTWLPGEVNRFCWNQEAIAALYGFGRWIVLSTLLTFLAGQGDRLVLGWVMDVRFLGIYTIAITLSSVPWEIITQLVNRVLFPSYSEVFRDRPERLYSVLRRSRLILIAFSWVASLLFIAFGQELVSFLYDSRYDDAGWILQTLALGSLGGVLGGTYDGILLARGNSLQVTALLAIQIVLQFGAMVLGFQWGGQEGVIIGLAATRWILYPFRALFYARISLWQPEVDLPLLALGAAIVAWYYLA